MKLLNPLFTPEQIRAKLKEVCSQISIDYTGKKLTIVMVLKGALCLVADMIRELNFPLEIQFVQCTSYGQKGVQRGDLSLLGEKNLQLLDQDVLVVDDIFDSGHTMSAVLSAVRQHHPRSVKSCTLLYKRDVEKISSYKPEYILFEIDNHFVVGYGLDYKEKYRNLPGIYLLGEM